MEYISSNIAQQIINEVHGILNQHLNIIDVNGIIIASSDPVRIGTFHGGAYHLITGQLSELPIHYDGEFPGAIKGDNLPLIIDNKLIGVIGITGEYDEIKKYGQIVKKMMEIMIKEEVHTKQKNIEQYTSTQILTDWILLERDKGDPQFAQRAAQQGIDIQISRRVFVVLIHPDEEDSIKTSYELRKIIVHYLKSRGTALVLEAQTVFICMVPWKSDNEMQTLTQELSCHLKDFVHVKAYIGIDEEEDSTTVTAHQAYIKALNAMNIGLEKEQQITFYKDVLLEILFSDVKRGKKEAFIKRIFGNMDKKEIEKSIQLLDSYYKHNGSVTLTAQELFVHKNTVQYNLNRLYEKTGYDPRTSTNTILFSLAAFFYKNHV